MARNISLKRLTASDLTFFEPHYRNTAGTKQKAINLDADVFVNLLFPALPRRLGMMRDRVIISLSIFGPAAAGAHNVTRKILKQQKNWRLNGELIVNPPEEPGRYDVLQRGDFAILAFADELEPSAASMYLVSQSNDPILHSALQASFGSQFSARRGMRALSPSVLGEFLRAVPLPAGHPIFDLIDDDLLEDAAQGGEDGVQRLQLHRRGRGVSREELLRAKSSAEYIGRFGEEVLKASFDGNRLQLSYLLGTPVPPAMVGSLVWESDVNAISPFDFRLDVDGSPRRLLEVKSTRGDFSNPLHISLAELRELAYGTLPYDIVRIYGLNEMTARMRICRNPRPFALDLMRWVDAAPQGTRVDSMTIDPTSLEFCEELELQVHWI